MRTYRWNQVDAKEDSKCERCSKQILAGGRVWERTGTLSFSTFEPGKDNLDPAYFCFPVCKEHRKKKKENC